MSYYLFPYLHQIKKFLKLFSLHSNYLLFSSQEHLRSTPLISPACPNQQLSPSQFAEESDPGKPKQNIRQQQQHHMEAFIKIHSLIRWANFNQLERNATSLTLGCKFLVSINLVRDSSLRVRKINCMMRTR